MENQNDISQELLETIEAYLNQTMDASQLADFKQRLDQDPDLQQQVEDVSVLLSGIEAAALKEKLDGFHSEMEHTPLERATPVIPIKKRKNGLLRYAAAAAILVSLGLFWIFNQAPTHEKLFAKHFTPDPGLPTTMSGSQQFEFDNAMVRYKQGAYQEAAQTWEQMRQQRASDTLDYFIGVAWLAEGASEKTIPLLEGVSTQSDSRFQEEAQFYLALAYIKENQMDKARKLLTFSSKAAAKTLLSELDN